MTTTTELTPLLKRLKLGAVLNTLPERVALARREQLGYASFLQIILTDEINRRDHRRLELRLQRAGFEQTCRLEDFGWSASVTPGRRLLDAAFSLQFLARNEHVLLAGPVGVGKSFIAQALGYAAIRAGHTVRFVHADGFFRAMAQARKHLGELEGRLERLEESRVEAGGPESVASERESAVWTPPKRAYGLPDAGVVMLEAQPDEKHAFGPAAELVAEWRQLRTGGAEAGSRVERARAEERRWELEVAMIGEFGLTLPPETEPLHESRRDDHLGWRREALQQARRERVRAERLRVVRRVLTFGLWWK